MEQIAASRKEFTGTNAERLALPKTTLKARDTWLESDTGDEYVFDGNGALGSWVQTSAGGAAYVAEIGIPSQRHNRLIDNITATWPGNDTFSVTWTQAEDVRRYRVKVTGGAADDYVKVVEDSVNEAQAEAWLGGAISTSKPPFTELQTDGTFSVADATGTGTTNTGWSWGAGPEWGIAGGIATSAADDGVMTSDQSSISGRRYEITYTVGNAALASGTVGGAALADVTVGTHTEIVIATSATNLCSFTAAATHGSATVDNVFISWVDQYQENDVEFIEVVTSTPTSATTDQSAGWSEWLELSKDPDDDSLSRLDFSGSAAGPFVVHVEAE